MAVGCIVQMSLGCIVQMSSPSSNLGGQSSRSPGAEKRKSVACFSGMVLGARLFRPPFLRRWENRCMLSSFHLLMKCEMRTALQTSGAADSVCDEC